MAKIKLISKTAKEPKSSKVKNVNGNNPKRVKTDILDDNAKPRKKKKLVLKKKVSSDVVPPSVKQPPAIVPEPLAWPELHEKAFPGWIGEFTGHASEHSEADPVAILLSLLLRLAAEIYGVFYNLGDSKHRARTNAVIVGESSKARKGTSWKPVGRLFKGLKNSARVTPGPLSSGQGLIYAVRDEMLEFDKKTGEYKVKDPGITDKRLFVLDEEFEVALNSVKNRGNTLSATIRGLYDDGNSEPLTKTSRIKTTAAHVVILAHITRVELTTALNKVQMANGFGNRFLWILVRRQKPIAMPKPMLTSAVKRFRKILAKRIESAAGLGALKMTKEAEALWEDLYPELTMDFSGAAGALINRSETHAIRLAEIYALALGHKMIQPADLEAAVAVVKYSRESAAIIFQGCPDDSRKVKILQALRVADKNKMTLTDISVKVFNRNVGSEAIQKMLNDLESSKLVLIRKIKGNTAGRKKTLVKLAPVGASPSL